MPDMPTILYAVDVQRRTRLAQQEAAGEERLVRWQCPDCKATCSGFVKAGASLERFCRGIPRKESYARGEVCGKRLEVVANLPAKEAVGR